VITAAVPICLLILIHRQLIKGFGIGG
jgi:hypothetical protein